MCRLDCVAGLDDPDLISTIGSLRKVSDSEAMCSFDIPDVAESCQLSVMYSSDAWSVHSRNIDVFPAPAVASATLRHWVMAGGWSATIAGSGLSALSIEN